MKDALFRAIGGLKRYFSPEKDITHLSLPKLPLDHNISKINGNCRATLTQSAVGLATVSPMGILYIAI